MRILCAILAATALQACAVSKALPPPPSEDVRLRMARMRISDLPAPPETLLDTPVQGWLAGIPAGACDVARAFYEVGLDPSADQAALLALLAPLGLVIGAFYGPFAVLPAETVERDGKLLREVLTRAGSGFAARLEVRARNACPSRIAREGEDAVLFVGPTAVSLNGPGWLDPQASPELRMTVRLVRTDGMVLYEAELRHRARPRPFTQWAASPDDLRDRLDQAFETLAERIVDEVFLTLAPSPP